MNDYFTKNKLLMVDLPEYLESDRIYLRPFQRDDGEAFFSILQDNKDHLKDVAFEVEAISTKEEAEIRNRQLYSDWVARKRFVFAICEKSSETIIGENWIEPVNKDLGIYELGYFVVKPKEGQGYATEACKLSLEFVFRHLNGKKVEIHTDATNDRSCRVAERLGFTKEGHLRNRAKTGGDIVDRLYYGLLSPEFEE